MLLTVHLNAHAPVGHAAAHHSIMPPLDLGLVYSFMVWEGQPAVVKAYQCMAPATSTVGPDVDTDTLQTVACAWQTLHKQLPKMLAALPVKT
jgi:hypothetical protein